MSFIQPYYQYIIGILLGCIITLGLNSKVVTTENFHVSTKTETKTIVKQSAKSKCKATVQVKKDGTVTVSTESKASDSTRSSTSGQIDAETITSPTRSRGLGLGVRYHASITNPLDVSKERIEAFVSIPVSSSFSIEAGYQFNRQISLGVRYDF
jgi:hypothetical protein